MGPWQFGDVVHFVNRESGSAVRRLTPAVGTARDQLPQLAFPAALRDTNWTPRPNATGKLPYLIVFIERGGVP
jgi:hypothetical protein